MRFAVAPVALSLVLLAAPAFAQSGASTSSNDTGAYNNQGNGNSGTTENRSSENGSYGNQDNGNVSTMNHNPLAENGNRNWETRGISLSTRQKIRQSLSQNGFTNIRIMPEAFVVHAVAPDGSPVAMEVAPDQSAAVVAPNQASGSSSPNNNETNQPGSANGNWNQNNSNGNGNSR